MDKLFAKFANATATASDCPVALVLCAMSTLGST